MTGPDRRRLDLVEDINWPPRSPYEALMSSPSGRKKAQEMLHRRRNAPSRPTSQHGTPNGQSKANQLLDEDADADVDDLRDDADDEETLQLKLAAIEARLKLKKLQQSRAKSQALTPGARPSSSDSSNLQPNPKPAASPLPPSCPSPPKESSADQDGVQVQVSPTKKPERSQDPASPRRVRLGIDKGVRAPEVSLKWRRTGAQDRPEGLLSRHKTDPGPRGGPSSSGRDTQLTTRNNSQKPASFSDRLLEQRSEDKARREKAHKAHKLQQNKSTAFAVDRREIESYQAAASAKESKHSSASTSSNTRRPVGEFSKDDVNSYHQPSNIKKHQKSEHSHPNNGSKLQHSTQESHDYGHRRPNSATHQSTSEENHDAEPEDKRVPDPSKFEAHSGLHLSKRILPHSFLKRTLATATPMRVPDLLRTIKPPSFDPPEVEGDYVVFGVVASKSSPRDHKEKQNADQKEKDPFDDGSNNSSKYMVLTLTDLQWSIDLFLFSTAFPRYYKLAPGTVVAILNPSIMPPPPRKIDTNAFSLTVSSSDDTILEIGTARDIGFCKSTRKDGKVCEAWVDARKTEFCHFHVELQLKKTKSQRMGVNSGTGILGDRGGKSNGSRGGRTGGKGGGRGGGSGEGNGLKNEGGVYDRATTSTYYVAPSTGGKTDTSGFSHRSAASLIDADDPFVTPGGFHRGADSKDERFRRRLVEQKRERDIAQQLGELKSVGSEYLRAHHSTAPSSTTTAANSQNNAAQTSARDTLGLDNLSKHAKDVKLGRSKKRALDTDKETPKSTNTGKKTRFITPKGIREAGRDSLGDTTLTTNAYDDDDDDLDIV